MVLDLFGVAWLMRRSVGNDAKCASRASPDGATCGPEFPSARLGTSVRIAQED